MMSTVRSLRKRFGVKKMRCDAFIKELFAITADYDGDGNGLCGESNEEVVEILKNEYPTLFEAYEILKGAK